MATRITYVPIALMLLAFACQRPFSPQQYGDAPEGHITATICHNDRRTMVVSPEDWKLHREHGDYRGPCRERRIAGPSKPVKRKHTSTSFDGSASRKKRSEQAYEATRLQQAAVLDSLTQLEQ